MRPKISLTIFLAGIACLALQLGTAAPASAQIMATYSHVPPFVTSSAPPLVMLVLGRDHKLYYEAYNDASDLNEDGNLDVGYQPSIDYYGYFDSYKCYTYDAGDKRFEPTSTNTDKKCSGAGEWSGDFLNYLTMCRMDALRKVLYGGYRSTDTSTVTVLERAYVPRDGHTWGKEYESIARDGYDIRDYTPLSLPSTGTRHMFASTSLADPSDSSYAPLLRVMPNNSHRIWEWVAKERPVADGSLTSGGGQYDSYPSNHEDYNNMVHMFANAAHLQGSGAPGNGRIDGSGNPYGSDDYYLNIFSGTLNITTGGTYELAVDGDDAVEVIVDGLVVAGWYDGHGNCGCQDHNGSISLTAGAHTLEFRHQERSGGDNYYLYWKGPDSGNSWQKVPSIAYSGLTQTTYDVNIPGSSITDYVVRVLVGDASMPEDNCKHYPSGVYKPTGLLQKFGENGRMMFGLLSGSYAKNTAGGVLRKNIGTIADEINSSTGQFTSTNGIINTMNKLRIKGFRYGSSYDYNENCGWITTRAINAGECRMWGNPVAEMMYETLRYFSGSSQTADYDYSGTTDDSTLGLPKASWTDPYSTHDKCAKGFMLILSEVNPSFDTDQLPGSYFNPGFGGSLTKDSIVTEVGETLDVWSLANTIATSESMSGEYYVGQYATTFDTSCSPKDIIELGKVRGLCPEEPTKQGGYYSASVANYGRTHDLNAADGNQTVLTYSVGLASPLPRIEIPIAGNTITLVPFAKSVGGSSISATRGNFQPTNTIVDFFVQSLTPTYGKFRINFEDVEQGADHDMDAIIIYEYQMVDASDNPVTDPANGVAVKVTLTSEYAAGGIIQHCGYIISGTTTDGTYLEVRDEDTGSSSDPDYFLDTPPGVGPNQGPADTNWDDNAALPLIATRKFTPRTTGSGAAELLKNPLWYSAKWGGFDDQNNDGKPDATAEWDEDNDGSPDTYFYVTNPLYLEEKLTESFAAILQKASSGTAVSVLATSSEGEGTLIQAYFKPSETSGSEDVTWVGYLHALWVDNLGRTREDTTPQGSDPGLVLSHDKIVEFFFDEGSGEAKFYRYQVNALGEKDFYDTNTNGVKDTGEDYKYTIHVLDDLQPIWEGGSKLADRTDRLGLARNIWTYIDRDNDGDRDSDNLGTPAINEEEFIPFSVANANAISPWLGVKNGTTWARLGSSHADRTKNLIKFILGDKDGYTGNPTLRNRSINGQVWKLGDIIHSTPVTLGRPMDNYGLIYGDQTYQDYYNKYKSREQVVYVGGNDGMLHAFYMGRYNTGTNPGTADQETVYFDKKSGTLEGFGDELWGYIPQALLPHLKWLSDENYSHVYYVDLKPKVVDARIFTSEWSDPSGVHPNGWGTVLICGLRMGGKSIGVTDEFPEGGGGDATRTFTSSYFAIDVTDPHDPNLLWERSYTNLGLTTSLPTVAKVGDSWFAIFGSGPTDYDGYSVQKGSIYVVDLATGQQEVRHECAEDLAFMGSPITVDVNLNYNVDVGYIGESFLSGSTNLGMMYVIRVPKTTDEDGDWQTTTSGDVYNEDPATWSIYNMLHVGGPVTASASASFDSLNNLWLYFGTGRYFGDPDKTDMSHQYFFGVKDPYYNSAMYSTEASATTSKPWAWGSWSFLNSSDIKVYTDLTVGSYSGGTTWGDLITGVRAKDGWYTALRESDGSYVGERVLNKPTVLGGIVFDTTFLPSADPCGFGGSSNLLGLYYETGTSYYKPIFSGSSGYEEVLVGGETKNLIKNKALVGIGRGSSVAIHVGQQDGVTGYVQQSTGIVEALELSPAFKVRSGFIYWRER